VSDFTPEQLRVLRALADGLLNATGGNGTSSGSHTPSGKVATEYEMSGQYGDPTIKKDPKRWAGRSYVGCRYSQTEPEYLDMLAGFLDWSADNPRQGKEKYAAYDRKDASRARGWASKLRGGWRPTEAAPDPGAQYADESEAPAPEYADDGEGLPF
jgi:hypothetical protein